MVWALKQGEVLKQGEGAECRDLGVWGEEGIVPPLRDSEWGQPAGQLQA